MITAFIKGQAIETAESVIVAESLNYLKAQFVFVTNDWNGLIKTAYFTQGETTHPIDLDENNIATPIHLGSGTWSVCVVGKEYKNGELVERITTDSAEITVKPFKVGKDTPFPEILPTEAERIEAKIGDLSKLETKNKSDLVGAINEANSKTGGGSTIPEETFANIEANTDARHYHNNKPTLDKFGTDVSGIRPSFEQRPIALTTDIPTRTSPNLVNNIFLDNDVTIDPTHVVSGVSLQELIDNIRSRYATLELVESLTSPLKITVADVLPEVGEENTIYLVPNGDGEPNFYDEYLYINEVFELIGNTKVDLTDYYTKEQIDSKGFITLQDLPEVPTKTSQLENDSKFVVASDVFDNTKQAYFTNVLDKVTLTQGKYLSGNYADYNDYPNTNATSFEEYIPVSNNAIIRMKDVCLGATSSVAKVATYDASYTFLNEFKTSMGSTYNWDILETTEDGSVTSFQFKNRGSIAYMRFCFRTADIGENPIVTINEEITYEMGYGDKLNSKIKVDQSQILNAPQKNCWSILPYEHLNIAYSKIDGRKPMNTVEHFKDVATNFNFNVLKADVEPTSDGELVCCHDKGFTFDTNGNITYYDPNNSTLIHDVTAETCLGYTHPTGEHVCLIGDFLSVCRQYGKVAFITIRERYMDVVIPKLLSELKKHNMMYSTIINSMTYDSLVAWRTYDTSVMANYTLYAEQAITTETIDKALNIGYCSHCGLGFTRSNSTPDTVCNFDYARERGIRLLQSIAYVEGSVENCYALGYDGCQIGYAWNPKNQQ